MHGGGTTQHLNEWGNFTSLRTALTSLLGHCGCGLLLLLQACAEATTASRTARFPARRGLGQRTERQERNESD